MVTYEQYKQEQDRLSRSQGNKQTIQAIEKKIKQVKQYVKSRPTPDYSKPVKIGKQTRPKAETSKALVRLIGYGNQTAKQKGAGRPKQVFIHRSPFNNQPIPAPQYYKELRLFKRQQAVLSEKRQQQILNQMAQRGIPTQPQQVQIPQNQQIQAQSVQTMPSRFLPRPMPVQQIPMQPVQARPIWRNQGIVGQERDTMGNVKQMVYGREQSFWN